MQPSTTFSVAPEIFDRFPDYIVGWVIVSDRQNSAENTAISALLSGAEGRAQLLYAERDLKEEPAIAVWRRAFSTLGWSASKYPSSVEAILKRVSRRGTLPRVNTAVDLANAATLLYLVPVGCHDLDLVPVLQVRPAVATDDFLPMGEVEPEKPLPGEFVYAAGNSVRTRRWVWRQSRDALVGTDANTLFFPVDGFSSVTHSRVEAATEFLASVCREHFSPDVTTGLISRDQPAML
ncbi:phenylalanine--tRNA ligase beta subunit-related protein [soil metagenome]